MLGYTKSIALNEVFECQGKVIAGEGKASKELGIPTANIEIDSELTALKLKQLLTGVYNGTAELRGV